jgi:hypothetical protein
MIQRSHKARYFHIFPFTVEYRVPPGEYEYLYPDLCAKPVLTAVDDQSGEKHTREKHGTILRLMQLWRLPK